MSEFNQFAYQNKYNKEKYDSVTIVVPKGEKDVIKQAAKERGKSVSEYIRDLIKADLEKDNSSL